jgi:DNA-directed RNA polymerase subunit RPC12/RpoP
MHFKTTKQMIDYLRSFADSAEARNHEADLHNNYAPWVGQINPDTGVYVHYRQVYHNRPAKLRECANMLESLSIIADMVEANVDEAERTDPSHWEIGEYVCPNCGELIHPTDDAWVTDGRGCKFCSQKCLDQI